MQAPAGRGVYREKSDHLLIGLMSGTSLDGVDAALVSIRTDASGEIEDVTLESFEYFPYSDELRSRLHALCAVETARLDELVLAHFGLAEWYAHAVRELLAATGTDASRVDAVCVHGQTVWHAPDPAPFPGPEGVVKVRSSLQIGDLSVLAERTGIPVVGNFRARDLAAGGEGAPLVPYADAVLFRDAEKGRVLQNIGGIANATVIPSRRAGGEVIAFDTGPGNMVIDGVVQLETDGRLSCDEEGAIAAEGRVSEELLARFLRDPYYERQPPKSTGRERYGRAFAREFRQTGAQHGLSFADVVATATALTAETIAGAYRRFVFPRAAIHEVIASGGGTRNRTLMRMLRDRLPDGVSLATTAAYGIPDDAKEAVAFAVLGHETLMNRPSNLPAVTGAARPVVLGCSCQ